VAIIGDGSFNKMPVGFTDKKPDNIKGKIPATVKPGKYKLRTVILRNGETEWKVVTDSVGTARTAYEFKVKEKISSQCYDNKPANCQKYGLLYNWETAKKVCPSGWHLPNDKEWDDLAMFLESQSGESGETGIKLLDKSWKFPKGYNYKVTDKFNFSALQSGKGAENGRCCSVDDGGAFWWSASENEAVPNSAYYWSPGVEFGREHQSKLYFFSVRCIQD